jgi:hypothetical protein
MQMPKITCTTAGLNVTSAQKKMQKHTSQRNSSTVNNPKRPRQPKEMKTEEVVSVRIPGQLYQPPIAAQQKKRSPQ